MSAASVWAVEDLFWMVGFLEGEGSFHAHKRRYAVVTAVQKDPETLHRLQSLAGGHIYLDKHGFHYWKLSGPPARALMQVLLPHMSSRRTEQINRVLTLDSGIRYAQGREPHLARVGHINTPEHRQKISEGLRAWHRRRYGKPAAVTSAQSAVSP